MKSYGFKSKPKATRLRAFLSGDHFRVVLVLLLMALAALAAIWLEGRPI